MYERDYVLHRNGEEEGSNSLERKVVRVLFSFGKIFLLFEILISSRNPQRFNDIEFASDNISIAAPMD